MRSLEVSQAFIKYYQEQGFSFLPSASLLHPSAPMSFVMSAGLAQIETALNQPDGADGNSYVLLQECFRYFDVGAVGINDVHLSLFEMPGAFSFVSNGAKETFIQRMWELVTATLAVDRHHLWITYFAGGKVSGHLFDEDKETYRAWMGVGVPKERIIGLGVDANFWKQGGGIDGVERYRKCGPNTEIFFDRGPQLSCSSDCRPGCRCGRFVEFANSLFIDSVMDEETNVLSPMDVPFAETVIGTERVAMILQGENSVHDIDNIRPIISSILEFDYSPGLSDELITTSERVLADHLRALSFLVADGAPPPGKGGRCRLIKILIRRVLTHQRILGINDHRFLPTIIDAITNLYEDYPKLAHSHDILLTYFTLESERFERTLNAGKRELIKCLKRNGGNTLTGEQILHLEKQRGVPSILVKAMLEGRGLPFQKEEYQDALREWKRSLQAYAN